jgi:hypothetical protein
MDRGDSYLLTEVIAKLVLLLGVDGSCDKTK